ncbi:MAG: Sec-independent protein translocase protein TatB [Proteobacteria bacterium]|nr:Sec-independent protein translocase protein TatB [Pseudomonadota bacterium]
MFEFGVGYSELFVLAVIAVIVIGPKDLPKVLRAFGQFMSKARKMASEFQGHVDAAMKETGVSDLKKDLDSTKNQFKSVMSAPNVISPLDESAKAQGAKAFDDYFGDQAPAGETKVAGVTAGPSSTS